MFRLLREISPEQVDEWIAFDEIEPLGLEKLYRMLALHGAHSATTQGWEIPPERFYPQSLDEDCEPMSKEEFVAAFRKLA